MTRLLVAQICKLAFVKFRWSFLHLILKFADICDIVKMSLCNVMSLYSRKEEEHGLQLQQIMEIID